MLPILVLGSLFLLISHSNLLYEFSYRLWRFMSHQLGIRISYLHAKSPLECLLNLYRH